MSSSRRCRASAYRSSSTLRVISRSSQSRAAGRWWRLALTVPKTTSFRSTISRLSAPASTVTRRPVDETPARQTIPLGQPRVRRRLANPAQRLMPQHQSLFAGRRLAILAGHDLQVGSADTDRQRIHQNRAIVDRRSRHLLHGDRSANLGSHRQRAHIDTSASIDGDTHDQRTATMNVLKIIFRRHQRVGLDLAHDRPRPGSR
jgi:hypothetical protein